MPTSAGMPKSVVPTAKLVIAVVGVLYRRAHERTFFVIPAKEAVKELPTRGGL